MKTKISKIKKNKPILLLSETKSYLIPCQGKFSCKYGAVDLDKVVGKKFGITVKLGKQKFSIINPNIRDMMFISLKRGPAVILPEDAAMIVAQAGIGVGSKVIEAGSGSGFLSIFLANIGCDVYSYELRKEHFLKAKNNILRANKKVHIFNKDILKARLPKDMDLVVLDMKYADKVVKKAYASLKHGGWLCVYSLHIEQMAAVVKAMKKFQNIKILECLQRKWQSQGKDETYTRPKTHMLGHTGFLIFGRKA